MFSLTACEKELVERINDTQEFAEAGSNARLVADQYIVEFVDDGNIETEDQMLARIRSITNNNTLGAIAYYTCIFKAVEITLSSTELQALRNSSQIAAIEQVTLIDLPAYESQSISAPLTETPSWGAIRVGQDNAHVYSGVGKRVWIIDSGIQMNHPDLNVNATLSKSFVPGITSPADQTGHGTGVAGIIGAIDNTEGVIGIAAGADLVSLKIFGTGSSTSARVIAALDYICQNGKPGEVVNISFGDSTVGATAPETLIEKNIKRVANRGLFVTIAAGQKYSQCPNSTGNCGVHANTFSPARINYSRVYTVSGLRTDDSYLRISNWGNPPIDYCAPGTGINTTNINSGYASRGGTSFAAPHLAGILAVKGQDVKTDGYVTNDPDGTADPICHLWDHNP